MQHVIIGTGPAGVVAAETIRSLDPSASITLVGGEPEPPYSRMAIPYLLVGNIEEQGTYLRKTDGYFEKNGIDVVQDKVCKLDAIHKKMTLESGGELSYDKLLIATGSHPIRPPVPGLDNPRIRNCWTLEDARHISESIDRGHSAGASANASAGDAPKKAGFFARLMGKAIPEEGGAHAAIASGRPRVVLIGAGFIGCIILESLVKRDAELTVIEQGDRMVPRMLDEKCGGLLKTWCENLGVNVLTSTRVSEVKEHDGIFTLSLATGGTVEAEVVICATGVAPNVDFLKGTGIKVEQGILVDEYLQTNVPDIYAAGDVAQSNDFMGGKSVQAIQPVAADHARIAGTNMVLGHRSLHQGSLVMNVLDTLGLISVSYGAWDGVEGGESTELFNAERFRYICLQFDGDVLVGANTLGITEHVGSLRGMIQSRLKLGKWKHILMDDPLKFPEAYLALMQGKAA